MHVRAHIDLFVGGVCDGAKDVTVKPAVFKATAFQHSFYHASLCISHMAAVFVRYKRCSVKNSGCDTVDDIHVYDETERWYGCVKPKEEGKAACPNDETCKCFVVATREKLKITNKKTGKEATMDDTRDKEKDFNFENIQDADEQAFTPFSKSNMERKGRLSKGEGEKSFKVSDGWEIRCRCLAIDKDGNPVKEYVDQDGKAVEKDGTPKK